MQRLYCPCHLPEFTFCPFFCCYPPLGTPENKNFLKFPYRRFPKMKALAAKVEMRKTELVFVPSPGIGHAVSTVELAKCLLGRDETLVITILTMKAPSVPNLDSYTQEVAASNNNIRFITLPPVDPPPSNFLKSPENYLTLLMESQKSQVKDAIINEVLPKSTTSLAGLVIDMFCSSMIDVANELEIPSYVFFTSSAAFLAIMLHLPIHYSQNGREFDLSDPDSIILGFTNPVPSRVLPSFVFNQEGGYKSFLNHAVRFKETKGIFINTILELETNAIESLQSETETPPIYTVGPLLNLGGRKEPDSQHEKIMKWLDDQPLSSVVFLCFGSLGTFEKPQLVQTAKALEQSGHRFLWSIRWGPPRRDFSDMPSEYTNLSEALPEGFIERTENRGLVCGWAPQVEVLAHQAVGGFVSHCGWNSILESVWHGVPIVTWPIYAEQQTNAFQLVKELGFAVELTLDYRIENGDKHVIMADEIENAIRCLMDTQNPVRTKAKEMGEISRTSMKNGGSSFASIDRLIEYILVNKR